MAKFYVVPVILTESEFNNLCRVRARLVDSAMLREKIGMKGTPYGWKGAREETRDFHERVSIADV